MVTEAVRSAKRNLGATDHDTLTMMAAGWLSELRNGSGEAAQDFLAFYSEIVAELGPTHPVVRTLREAAVEADVFDERF